MDIDMLEQTKRTLDAGRTIDVVARQTHDVSSEPPAVASPYLEHLCGIQATCRVAEGTSGKLLNIHDVGAGEHLRTFYHVDWDGQSGFYTENDFERNVRLE